MPEKPNAAARHLFDAKRQPDNSFSAYQAVDSMRKLFSNPKGAYDQASALVALKGRLTMDNRDNVLAALNEDIEEGYKNGRFRYYGIEAVESLLPDPAVQDRLPLMNSGVGRVYRILRLQFCV